MKAYKDKKGKIRLFRPDLNMKRMDFSMQRLAMPSIDGDAVIECIKELLKIDESWIPDEEGYSMYIRPTAIGTSPVLGVHASEQVNNISFNFSFKIINYILYIFIRLNYLSFYHQSGHIINQALILLNYTPTLKTSAPGLGVSAMRKSGVITAQPSHHLSAPRSMDVPKSFGCMATIIKSQKLVL